jgi:hypothetical protein
VQTAKTFAKRLARVRAAVPLGRLFLVVLGLVLALAAVEAYRARAILADVNAGRDDLRAGQNQLELKRLSATPEDLALARARFEDAGKKFSAAHSRLSDDPALKLARRLPWAGDQLRAAEALASIGEQASVIGGEGIDAADAFDGIRGQATGTLPEKSQLVFDAVDPHIAGIESRMADVNALRDQIGDQSLLPPVRRALRELDARRRRLRDFLDTYHRARAFSPEFLGFNGQRTYLILAQNNAELLPTGGLVSVFGTVRLDHGRVEDMQFHDAVQFGEDWMARTGDYVEPPAPLKQYLLKDTSWNLTVSNWSPNFPTAARAADRFYQLGGGGPVDGVIAMNVTTLERLLEIIGAVDVPQFDVKVDSSNAYGLIEANTREPYKPAADRKEFVALLADEVLHRVLKPEKDQWSPLVDLVQKLGDEKDLMLFSYDPKQQELVGEFGWDGGVTYSSGDYLQVVDASLNSTKLNEVIEHSADVDVRLDANGAATTTVKLSYFNNLAPWASDKDPEFVRKLMLGGMYGGYTRLLTPPGTRVLSVQNGGAEVGVEEVGREQGLTVFGRFFAMPRDTHQQLAFTYMTVPVVDKQPDGWTYRLRLRRQPGWELPLTIRIEPPPGMRSDSVLLDGAPYAAHSVDMKIDLSQDRLLTVHFRRA